jgi:indole-3-acetate monooxygenase
MSNLTPTTMARNVPDDPLMAAALLAALGAAGDASTGWCAAIGMGVNFLSGYLPRRAAGELFGDIARPSCAVFAPTGRARRINGSFELTGRWAFTSGCNHAAVQACGMFVVDDAGIPELSPDGAPALRLAFVPAQDLDVVESWDTAGLRGTGSHDTVAQSVRVPEEHTMTFADRPWAAGPIYLVPPFCVLAACLASVALGIGRAALDDFEDRARSEHHQERRPGARPRFDGDPIGQLDLGAAEVRLRAARLLLVDSLQRACALSARGLVPRETTALVGLACREAAIAGAHAVDVACSLTGSAAVREGRPLERLRRDIDTLRKHQVLWAQHAVPLGRQLAGIPTVAFPFLSRPLAAEETP